MNTLNLLILGVVIGSNNLAVSFALGALGRSKYHARIIFTFGFFEFTVPLVGILIGNFFSEMISEYASVVGAALLVILGGVAVYKSFGKAEDGEELAAKITTWKGIVFLAVGLSLDNLIIGFSLGLKNADPLMIAGAISLCSMVFSFSGLKLGKALSARWQKLTERISGFLLIALGVATYFGWI